MDGESPDFTRLPSGEREWSDFIHQAAAMGAAAERHFIELKSDVDPTGKEGAAKVAKFILGTAHRDPVRAANYLDGYAVMILGVAKDDVQGLPRFEAKDLVGAVQQYVGEPGPRWDFVRIRVDNDRDVIVITVEPPQGGIWPCCREGVGLKDGRIYVRADGETREANHDEMRALIQRSQAGATAAPPGLTVGLSGAVHRYANPEAVLDEYIAIERERLEEFAPSPDDEAEASRLRESALGTVFTSTTRADHRSRADYVKEIDDWEAAMRTAWPKFVMHGAIAISDGAHIEACSQRYLGDVKIKIRLEGPVRALKKSFDSDDFDDSDLPEPPRPWGPETVEPYRADPDVFDHLVDNYPLTANAVVSPLFSRYIDIDIDNSDSVKLEVLAEELRPGDPYVSSEALFLWVKPDHEGPITGTWTATAKARDEIHSGEIRIEVEEPTDLTEPLHAYLYSSETVEDVD